MQHRVRAGNPVPDEWRSASQETTRGRLGVLFVCGGNSQHFDVAPFIRTQAESLSRQGADVSFFVVKGRGIHGYLKAALKVRRLLRNGTFDVVHAHYAYCGLAALLAGARKRLVVSFMGNDLYGIHDVQGRLTPRGRLNMALSRLVARFAGSVIVKSQEMLVYLPHHISQTAHVVPNGVDTEKLRPLDQQEVRHHLGLQEKKTYLLFLGDHADTRKGHAVAEQAAQLLVGRDVELLAPYPVSHNEIPLYMNAADVLVFVSSHEGSPNVIKEAMACNLPIVSTDVGDVSAIVGNTEGCFIVERDAKSVASGIERAIAFGRRTRGRENILHLELESVAGRVLKVYRDLLMARNR